jgi:hypothetical protein
MAFLYGRGGRLTTKNGGSWPGQTQNQTVHVQTNVTIRGSSTGEQNRNLRTWSWVAEAEPASKPIALQEWRNVLFNISSSGSLALLSLQVSGTDNTTVRPDLILVGGTLIVRRSKVEGVRIEMEQASRARFERTKMFSLPGQPASSIVVRSHSMATVSDSTFCKVSRGGPHEVLFGWRTEKP